MVNFTAILLACALALLARIVAGRLATLGVTAICSAFMAYFLMPPVYSFRVERTSDLAALTLFGGMGLVLTKAKRRKRTHPIRWTPAPNPRPRAQLENIAAAVETLLVSDLGSRLRAADIAVDLQPAVMPWTHEEAIPILSAVISEALGRPGIRRISIYGERRPGIHRLVVTAHHVWPPPLNVAIAIGKSDRQNCGGAWFDNGYDYISEIVAEDQLAD